MVSTSHGRPEKQSSETNLSILSCVFHTCRHPNISLAVVDMISSQCISPHHSNIQKVYGIDSTFRFVDFFSFFGPKHGVINDSDQIFVSLR